MDNPPAPRGEGKVQTALLVVNRTSLWAEESARENGTELVFEEIMAKIFQK